ncbi:MAG: hypothetical protein QM496_10670 [Verrucomicrobiota bacterium]
MKHWRLASALLLLAIAGCDSPDGEVPIVGIQDPEIISLDLIEFHTGALNVHTMNAIGLNAADQVRLQRIVDELRADLSKFILESLRKRHDKYGNLLVEIPDARVEGRVFRLRLFEAIHENFGDAISIHFKGLFEEKWERGILYSLSEDWFHFGDLHRARWRR